MRRLIMLARGIALALVLLAPHVRYSFGAEPEAEEGEGNDDGWLTWERMTGDWGGARTALEERGLELELEATVVWQANHKGGLRSLPEGKLTTQWAFELALDTEKLGWWPDGTFVVLLEGSKGTGVDDRYVDSLIGVNDDDGDYSRHHARIEEYYYEHAFGRRLLVGAGVFDFDTGSYGDDPSNSFVDTERVPYPDYAPGLQMIVRPTDWLSLGAVALYIRANNHYVDREVEFAARTDWFFAAEAGVTVSLPLGSQELPGHYRLGAWHDTVRFERLDDEHTSEGARGYYVYLNQMLYREEGDEGDEGTEEDEDEGEADVEEEEDDEEVQGLGVFGRYSYEPDHYGEIKHLWQVGAQYTGPIPGRDRDALGISYAQAQPGASTRRELRYDYESVCDLYYHLAIGGGVELTFDVMYVRHPGAEEGSCFLPGLRLELDF